MQAHCCVSTSTHTQTRMHARSHAHALIHTHILLCSAAHTPCSENDAPLQFFFNGMRNLGQAAVPINMFIMGASLAKVCVCVCVYVCVASNPFLVLFDTIGN